MTPQERVAQAFGFWNTGRTSAAIGLCREILAEAPGTAGAVYLLGLIAERQGDEAAALVYWRQACEAPDAPAAYLADLARLCRRAGLLVDGARAGARAVARDGSHAPGWTQLGLILQECGQATEARACLQRAVALTPHNPEALHHYAAACARQMLDDQAELHWRRSLDLFADYPEPHNGLANLLCRQSRFDEAAWHARRAMALRADFAEAHLNLAAIERVRGNPAASLEVLEGWLAQNPEHAPALAAKALALHQLDRATEALAWARQAAAIDPAYSETLHTLSQLNLSIF